MLAQPWQSKRNQKYTRIFAGPDSRPAGEGILCNLNQTKRLAAGLRSAEIIVGLMPCLLQFNERVGHQPQIRVELVGYMRLERNRDITGRKSLAQVLHRRMLECAAH